MAGIDGSGGLDWGAIRPSLVLFLTRRTGCDAAAEDLAQELWLKLQAASAAAAEIRNPVAYMFRSAANAAKYHSIRKCAALRPGHAICLSRSSILRPRRHGVANHIQ